MNGGVYGVKRFRPIQRDPSDAVLHRVRDGIPTLGRFIRHLLAGNAKWDGRGAEAPDS
ncbi:MAG: hypothetical protein JWO57_2612 [Pseudonocardiales bacterium]|nr:hypothetical protein [Pseudonocardiales bacterium]